MNLKTGLTALTLIATAAISGFATPISWVDWTAQTSATSVLGTLTVDAQTIGVTYTGQVNFAQTSGGTYYYTGSSYTSSTVSNAPATSDIISITGGVGMTQTITFAQAVVNPVLAIVSLGQNGYPVRYIFDQNDTILSAGGGYWGGGAILQFGANGIVGYEGHGAVEFLGTYSSISWEAPDYENWHGFTIGAAGLAPTVPEPSPIALGLIGFASLAVVGYRRTRNA